MEKKTKKIVETAKNIGKKATVGTVVASLLFSACTIDKSSYNLKDGLYGEPTYGQTKKDLLKLSEIGLSEELTHYINIINEIVADITISEESAKLFCEDTNKYLETKNFAVQTKVGDIDFHLTEKDKKFLLAFTDKEIFGAVQNRDFEAFISLCIQKGYFSDVKEIITINYEDYRPFFNSNKDYERFVNTLNIINGIPQTRSEYNVDEECAIGVPIVAVGFGAVEIGVVADKLAWISGMETPRSISNEPALMVWYNENPSLTEDEQMLFYDEAIVSRVTSIVNVVSQEFPNVDTDVLQNFLILNFKAYYGLK